MTAPQYPIDPAAHIGPVHLNVSMLDRSLEFYQQMLGFQLLKSELNTVHLGVEANGAPSRELLLLTEQAGGAHLSGTTGLYHFAILVPTREDLGRSLKRLLALGWQPQGFADHLVSEAIYLADPDGNGIEIYVDRPRPEWPRQDGRVQMKSLPLDVDELMRLAGPVDAEPHRLPHDTVMGHIHLRVSDIAEAEAFYCGVLGFELMQRYEPSASFVSAGGYHHHIGMNTWESAGAPPPPEGTLGLRYFTICLPHRPALEALAARLQAAGIPTQQKGNGLLVRDPAGNALLLTTCD